MTTHMNTFWNMLYLERPPRATWEIKQSSTKDAGILIYCIIVEHVRRVHM